MIDFYSWYRDINERFSFEDTKEADALLQILASTCLGTDIALQDIDIANLTHNQLITITRILTDCGSCDKLIGQLWNIQQEFTTAIDIIESTESEHQQYLYLCRVLNHIQHSNILLDIIKICRPLQKPDNSDTIKNQLDIIWKWIWKSYFDEIRNIVQLMTSIKELRWTQMQHDIWNRLNMVHMQVVHPDMFLDTMSFNYLEYLIHFLQSYCVSNISQLWDKIENIWEFYESQKSSYHLSHIIDVASHDMDKIQIQNDIDPNTCVYWLQWVMCIDIYNILRNSFMRGGATQVRIYVDDQEYLCIADNGSGIDTQQFPDPNTIFTRWVSGNKSTGIGLKNDPSLGIDMQASNQWLDSVCDGISKWALIKIKLDGLVDVMFE